MAIYLHFRVRCPGLLTLLCGVLIAFRRGALTVLFGLFCFTIPDSPMDAWFLTKEEKIVAVERLRSSQTGILSLIHI